MILDKVRYCCHRQIVTADDDTKCEQISPCNFKLPLLKRKKKASPVADLFVPDRTYTCVFLLHHLTLEFCVARFLDILPRRDTPSLSILKHNVSNYILPTRLTTLWPLLYTKASMQWRERILPCLPHFNPNSSMPVGNCVWCMRTQNLQCSLCRLKE